MRVRATAIAINPIINWITAAIIAISEAIIVTP